MSLKKKLHSLFHRNRMEQDLDDEVQFHIEMRTRQHIESGMAPDQARRTAARAFGNPVSIRERTRDTWVLGSLEMLWQDVRYAARTIGKNPGFTVATVLTLALAIGANTAVFSVVNSVLLAPLPFPDPDRLVALREMSRNGAPINTSFSTYMDWKQSPTFEHIAALRSWGATLAGEAGAERLTGLRVSESFFRVIGVSPAIGRSFLPEEDRADGTATVILGYGLWQRRFGGEPDVPDTSITLNGTPYTVVGVMPADFLPLVSEQAYGSQAELWAPLAYEIGDSFACRGCRHIRAIGRVKTGRTLSEARADIETITRTLANDFPDSYSSGGSFVIPLHEEFVRGSRGTLWVLFGAVGFVLLVACANVGNLLLARAARREREMATRVALGAGRRRIVRQLLTEGLMLALMGAGAGTLLALAGTDLLVWLNPSDTLRLENAGINGAVLAFTLGISLACGMIFGLVPAVYLLKHDPHESLRAGGRHSFGPAGQRTRQVLVVSGVALALVLLIGAGLMTKSLVRLLNVDPGIDTVGVLKANVLMSGPAYGEDADRLRAFVQLEEGLGNLPGVEAVGLANLIPLGGNSDSAALRIEEKPLDNPADAPYPNRYHVSPGYFDAIGIPLIRGRLFTAEDREGAPLVVLVGETLARRVWGEADPMGKRIKLGGASGPWRSIVGVVGDVRHYGLNQAPTMQAYIPFAQNPASGVDLLIRSTIEPASLAASVRQQVRAIDKDPPVYGVLPLGDLVSQALARHRFTMLLLTGFAAVALAMAAVGVYGLISYAVGQRTREIGVRVALGAGRNSIFGMVMRQGVALAGVGVVAGLVASLWLTRSLETLLFEVEPTDPAVFVILSSLLLTIALAASYFPARRATRVDPTVALRHD